MSQMTQLGGADLDWDQVDRLHKALRIGKVSVTKMSEELGVHRNTVGNYLRGATPPDRRTLVTWAFACGVPFKWLDTGAEPTETDPDKGVSGQSTDTGRYSPVTPPSVSRIYTNPLQNAQDRLSVRLQSAA